MKHSEDNESTHTEETNEPSRFESFVYYFDIFYRVVKALVIMLVVVLLVGGSLGAGAAIGYFASLVHGNEIPEHEEMVQQIYDFNQTSTLYYAGGEVVSDLRADLMRTPVSLSDISTNLVDAIIATEDEYFFDHDGIVPKAVARALVQDLGESSNATGGSTLTQQLIKQQIIGGEVSHERKANEILLAMRIENHLDKEEILEAYLNVSPFGRNNKGQNIAGVEEAAQGIFGVSASEVTVPQAAFIAGLPQRPNVFSPYTNSGQIKENHDLGLRRQREVLFRMHREGMINEEEYQEALDYDITQDFLNREEIDYEDMSYVYDLGVEEAERILFRQALERDGVTSEDLEENPELAEEYREQVRYDVRNRGYEIHTTIDRDIHRAMEQTAKEYQDELGAAQTLTWEDDDGNEQSLELPVQMAGSLIDNETGRVLGFIGGRDYEISQFNRAFRNRRSSGSVIKPLLTYGPAIEENIITPATIIPDTEVEVRDTWENGAWTYHTPTNVGPTTNDWITARQSLAESKNIAAIKINSEMTQEEVDLEGYIRRMGIPEAGIAPNEFNNATLPIGGMTGGPTPVELISAFSAIGNDGVHAEAHVIDRIINSEGEVVYEHESQETEVWSPESNYLLLDMLRDVHTDGTATGTMEQLNFESDWFSKTGTSNDRADIWYMGSTPRVTFGTWIGYDNQNLRLRDDFSIHPSRRNRNMWARIMNAVHEANPDIIGVGENHSRPEGVTEDSVIEATGMKSGTVETPSGSRFRYSGSTHTELFKSDNVPGTTVYDFAIGATDEELSEFWGERRSSDDDDDDDSDSSDSDDEEETETVTETEDDEADESDDDSSGEDTDEEPEANEEDSSSEESSSDDSGSSSNNGSSEENDSSGDGEPSNGNGSSNGNGNGSSSGNGSSNGNGNGSSNGNGNGSSEETDSSDETESEADSPESTEPEEPQDEEDDDDEEE